MTLEYTTLNVELLLKLSQLNPEFYVKNQISKIRITCYVAFYYYNFFFLHLHKM